MNLSRYVDENWYPQTRTLRDQETKVTVHKEGRVIAQRGSGPEVVIAEMADDAPAFLVFMDFWGSVFVDDSCSSLAFDQLVVELMAGRLVQNPYNPFLFMDKTRPHRNIENAFPLIEASRDMTMKDWNPDRYCANQVWALADSPRVFFYSFVEDLDGIDICLGYAVGVTQIPGDKPDFNEERIAEDQKGIMEIANPILSKGISVPERLQFAGYKVPFDDEIPM